MERSGLSGTKCSKALNLHLSLIGQSQVSLRSICAYFVRQTEPKILRLVFLDRVSSLYQVCGIGVRPGEPPPEQTLQVTHVRVVYPANSVSRPDCEAAIREILEQTGGKCPLCPGTKGWVWGGAGNEAKALD